MLLPERFHFDESKRLADYAAEPYARMLGQMGELYAVRKDGTEFPAEITLSPLETATGTFVISAVRDISQRKKAEEELRLRYVELTAKTAELERFNRAMVDRELRMIELKKEINTLLSESGHPPRFRSDFNVNPDFNLSPSSTQNSVIL
jgi:PAS domain-containing protein